MKTFVISFNQPHFGLFFMKKSFQNYERLRIYFLYLLPAKFAAQHCNDSTVNRYLKGRWGRLFVLIGI